MMASNIQRQDLVCLSTTGWSEVLRRNWDPPSRQCLAHWAGERLPLVVTQQTSRIGDATPGDVLDLGLPAPLRWLRHRIGLRIPTDAVTQVMSFPSLPAINSLLPSASMARWALLHECLAALSMPTHVYGSYGWQLLTGLVYLHPESDIDLLVRVPDAGGADRAASALARCGIDQPRLDGELLFADGSAVSWREWRRWRHGDTNDLLVKRRTGATLTHDDCWLHAMTNVAEGSA